MRSASCSPTRAPPGEDLDTRGSLHRDHVVSASESALANAGPRRQHQDWPHVCGIVGTERSGAGSGVRAGDHAAYLPRQCPPAYP
jgi:hypothetical protein